MKACILNISKFDPTLTHFELPQVFAYHLRSLYFIFPQGDFCKPAANLSAGLAGGTHTTLVYFSARVRAHSTADRSIG
jgi:hypothetical protein